MATEKAPVALTGGAGFEFDDCVEEVEAMLGKAEGWLRAAIALAAFAGLRQGEVRLVRGGANLEAARELAGHSKLHTTQRYVHATRADLRDAVARLSGN